MLLRRLFIDTLAPIRPRTGTIRLISKAGGARAICNSSSQHTVARTPSNAAAMDDTTCTNSGGLGLGDTAAALAVAVEGGLSRETLDGIDALVAHMGAVAEGREAAPPRVLVLLGAGVSVAAGIPDFRSPKDGLYARVGRVFARELELFGYDDPQEVFDIDNFYKNPQLFYTVMDTMNMWPPPAATRGGLTIHSGDGAVLREGEEEAVGASSRPSPAASLPSSASSSSTSSSPTTPPLIHPAPSTPRPTAAHHFVRRLADSGRLLRCYTQNIDGLERAAGIDAALLVEAHGTFGAMYCTDCNYVMDAEAVKRIVRGEDGDAHGRGGGGADSPSPRIATVPECPRCCGLIRPSIVFFGEDLPSRFHEQRAIDGGAMRRGDVCIVMGTSLQVYPFASIPSSLPSGVRKVLINKTALGAWDARQLGFDFDGGDVLLQDDCQAIAEALMARGFCGPPLL